MKMKWKPKNLYLVNAYVFGTVALLHLWRALMGLEFNLGSFVFPVWASFIAFLLAGYLSYLNHSAQ